MVVGWMVAGVMGSEVGVDSGTEYGMMVCMRVLERRDAGA